MGPPSAAELLLKWDPWAPPGPPLLHPQRRGQRARRVPLEITTFRGTQKKVSVGFRACARSETQA